MAGVAVVLQAAGLDRTMGGCILRCKSTSPRQTLSTPACWSARRVESLEGTAAARCMNVHVQKELHRACSPYISASPSPSPHSISHSISPSISIFHGLKGLGGPPELEARGSPRPPSRCIEGRHYHGQRANVQSMSQAIDRLARGRCLLHETGGTGGGGGRAFPFGFPFPGPFPLLFLFLFFFHRPFPFQPREGRVAQLEPAFDASSHTSSSIQWRSGGRLSLACPSAVFPPFLASPTPSD